MPWLSDKVLVQQAGQHLGSLLQRDGNIDLQAPRHLHAHRFVHLINPFACPAGSTADRVQASTYASMHRAHNHAAEPSHVDMLAVAFPEDKDYASSHFEQLTLLRRSILDVAEFKVPRKLPLLFDILSAEHPLVSAADYLIYTNSDICLMPGFYQFVKVLVNLGFDTVTINRRVIAHYSLQDMFMPLADADYGESHCGFDCFIFPASMVSQFFKTDACLGIRWVMRSLLYNLFALSKKMLVLTDVHMTYHLGDDKQWSNPAFSDYTRFNLACAHETRTHLQSTANASGQLTNLFAQYPLDPLEGVMPALRPPAYRRLLSKVARKFPRTAAACKSALRSFRTKV